MLKILGRITSINVRKVLWTCDELSLPFEREDWGTGFRDTHSEEFLRLNPNGLIPVLIEGDFVLWESNAIIRYLASANGASDLLPAEPRARAVIEQWMDWQATEFNNSWRYAFHALSRKNPAYNDKAEIQRSVEKWTRHMNILDRQLQKTGGHVVGDHFTLADIPMGLSVHRWFMTPIEGRADLPAVNAYYERLKARPAFNRYSGDIP